MTDLKKIFSKKLQFKGPNKILTTNIVDTSAIPQNSITPTFQKAKKK